jgi:AraC family transcriptional regulator, dual regulator of chb operon
MTRLEWQTRQQHFYVQHWQMTGPSPGLMHTHGGFAEVFWIAKGAGVHLVNGMRLPLAPGSLVLMRPKDRHGYQNEPGNPDGFLLVNIAFPLDTLDFLKKRYFPKDPRFFWSASKLPAQFKMSPSQIMWLQEWSLHLAKAPSSRLEIERFLLDLLYELIAHESALSQNEQPGWLSRALKEIHDPRHFVKGTRQLARLAGRSPEHVTRELKARLGITATDAVNQARLEHAAVQLRITTRKILDISLECGFQGLGHFYRTFQKQFGSTPREYREKHQHRIVP